MPQKHVKKPFSLDWVFKEFTFQKHLRKSIKLLLKKKNRNRTTGWESKKSVMEEETKDGDKISWGAMEQSLPTFISQQKYIVCSNNWTAGIMQFESI